MRYVPIMRTKAGELEAMQRTDGAIAQHMLPFFELHNVSWTNDDFEEKAAKLAKQAKKAWGWGVPCILDLGVLDGASRIIAATLEAFHDEGPTFVPAVNLERSPEFHSTMADVVRDIGLGICLRLILREDSPDLQQDLKKLLRQYPLPPEQVDVVIDFGASASLPRVLAPWLIDLVNSIPDVDKFRTFALAATTFPRNMGDYQSQAISRAPRGEWRLWREVAANPGLARKLDFGDYTAAYPEDIVFDPKKMSIGAKIKYTSEEDWLIVKGRGIKGRGYEQYRTLSHALTKQDEYTGEEFSWGDEFIQNCAEGKGKPGSARIWVSVAVNHHLAFVVNQLSRWNAP